MIRFGRFKYALNNWKLSLHSEFGIKGVPPGRVTIITEKNLSFGLLETESISQNQDKAK